MAPDRWLSRSRRGPRGGRRRAFTLLEALVSATVFSVGIGGVMATLSLGLRAAASSQRVDEASAIASEKVELLVATPGERLEDAKGSQGPYEWTVAVAERQYGLVAASVEVRWQDRGEMQTYRLSRVFLPRTLEQEE